MTEILGGLLSGNGLGKDWSLSGGHGINGVFLQALAVEEFQELNRFYDQVDELLALVKSLKCAPGVAEILLPGEGGRRREAAQREAGVELDDSVWMRLMQLAEKLGTREIPGAG